VRNRKKARAKWLQAWEEVKLELLGQYWARKRILSARRGFWQGRSRKTSRFIPLLLARSLIMAVMIRDRDHHQPFFGKFNVIKTRRKR
jgi:hypothetical protein